ncbi:unnamed protein product [Cuscuta epithymum]|uniref:F-box domain-containing protein n=1 Tax=Cuscuta epithymum TaxID=186058 RepID=A0AAV0C5C7_9ASTE|nr:unnamed protein product [Cuscuta epithymum]
MSLKRKYQDCCSRGHESSVISMDELNQDLLETVLSWLPTSSLCRLTSVNKRWKSVAESPTFRLACSEVPSRDPWFYMVDSQSLGFSGNHPVVYDSSEENWKLLDVPSFLRREDGGEDSCSDFAPVASSGGLLCFHSQSDGFVVSNPVTGLYRRIASPDSATEQFPLQAIAMASARNSYKLVLVSGDMPDLCFQIYDSGRNEWGEKTLLRRKTGDDAWNSNYVDDSEEYPVYFLSKYDDLVVSELQRSPCKQYSSVMSSKSGAETVYFLSPSGTVVACNLTGKWFIEYPRLLPLHHDYSIDLVECAGDVFAVVLSEYLESASLRLWRFNHEKSSEWEQVSAMPPAISHEFYGKTVDINCTGAGRRVFVCASCPEFCRYFICNLEENEWVEMQNEGNEFSCAFSFEPRIEAST